MNYTEEEIERFMEILKSVDNPPSPPLSIQSNRVVCKLCNNSIDKGYYCCEECCLGQGDVLGYHDKSDYERFYFSQKSIYKRKYHHQKKIKEVSNKFKLVLSEEGQYELYTKLMQINDYKLEKLNRKFRRKRLINIHF